MVIYDKNIKEISINDIETIVKESVIENKYLEFKGQMDRERDKILKTICGFANGDGGLFIYGIGEDNGKPSSIEGISLKDTEWDHKKRQIQDWIKTGIEPRIDVEIRMLKFNGVKSIILIKIPKSWNPPHCVKNRSNRIFYIRRDGITDSMEFEELRRMFDLNNSLIKRINEFRDERVREFESQNPELYKVIFHAVPLNVFSNNIMNLDHVKQELRTGHFIAGAYNYNFEGLYNNFDLFNKQFYRNGIFEMDYITNSENDCINVKYFQEEYLTFAKEVYELYQKLNIICPIIFFVSLTNIQGRERCTNGLPIIRGGVFDKSRSVLNPKGIIIENETQIENEVNNLFIQIWNHFGISKEYEYQK